MCSTYVVYIMLLMKKEVGKLYNLYDLYSKNTRPQMKLSLDQIREIQQQFLGHSVYLFIDMI